MNRRKFLAILGGTAGTVVLGACNPWAQEDTPTPEPTKAPVAAETEIPQAKPETPVGQLAAQKVVTDTVKAEAVAPEVKKVEPEGQSVFTGLRGLVLSIDETKPAWPEKGQGEPAITVHNEEDLDGNKVKGRSITQLNTGATDFEMASGGRWSFYGKVAEGIGLKASGVKHSEGNEVFLDKTSGEVLYVLKKGAKGTKVVIPGGTDTYLRGNLVFVVGKKDDNTATEFETDTASVYREKRNSGSLNDKEFSAEDVELVAAMSKVYVNSLHNGMNCKGKGCRDAVGVYVIRGGDKKTGAGAEIIFAAVYSGKELEGLKLKN